MPDVAVAVLHNRRTDQVLLIRRSRGTDFSGWVFPGGKIQRSREVDAHENPVAAARRELKEETGLSVRRAGKEIFCRKHPKTGVLIRYVYFPCDGLAPTRGASSQEPEKADDCAWVELSKVGRMFRGGVSDGLIRGIQRQLHAAKRSKSAQAALSLAD